MTTRVAAATYAGGHSKPATAAKSVVSRRTLPQGVVTPSRKSSASASVPIASSPAANVAVTAETIPAHANNTADNVRRKRRTVTAARPASRLQQIVCAVQYAKIESPQMSKVYAAKSVVNRKTRASRWQWNVCAVQCALNLSVSAAKTAESQIVESTAQGAKRS